MTNRKSYNRDHHLRLREASISLAFSYLMSLEEYEYDVLPIDQSNKENIFYLIRKDTKALVWFQFERRLVWRESGKWQGYPTLDVPARKGNTKASIYIQVNFPINTLALVSMRDVYSSPIKRKDTSVTVGEDFYAVPIDKVKIIRTRFEEVATITPKKEVPVQQVLWD